MPKPFPFPLNIGTDICHVKRIYDILTRVTSFKKLPFDDDATIKFRRSIQGKRFLHRVLNQEEIDDAVERNRIDLKLMRRGELDKSDTAAKQRMEEMATFLGGRWAAKEAIMKAFPFHQLKFHDITIKSSGELEDTTSSAPVAFIRPIVERVRTSQEEAQEVPISISHDGQYATAFALGFDSSKAITPSTPAAKEVTKLSYKPPKPEEPSHYPVEVSGLYPETDKAFLLDLFKIRYPSVRCVTRDGHFNGRSYFQPKSKPYSKGTVSFAYEKDAWSACDVMSGFNFFGTKLTLRPLTRYFERLEPDDHWLWNEDFEQSMGKENAASEKKETWETRLLRTQKLPPATNVFQDDPIVPIPTPLEKVKLRDRLILDSEEIENSSNWDSILGEKVNGDELKELVMIDEATKVEEAQRRKELDEWRTKNKGKDFAVPPNRRGFFIRE